MLNVAFDEYSAESMVGTEWQDKCLKILEEKGLIFEDNGAKKVDLKKYKLQIGDPVYRKGGAS